MPVRHDPTDDKFLFRRGPDRGLGAIRFHDWRAAYDSRADRPNVAIFREQADGFCELLRDHAPDEGQQIDAYEMRL